MRRLKRHNEMQLSIFDRYGREWWRTQEDEKMLKDLAILIRYRAELLNGRCIDKVSWWYSLKVTICLRLSIWISLIFFFGLVPAVLSVALWCLTPIKSSGISKCQTRTSKFQTYIQTREFPWYVISSFSNVITSWLLRKTDSH